METSEKKEPNIELDTTKLKQTAQEIQKIFSGIADQVGTQTGRIEDMVSRITIEKSATDAAKGFETFRLEYTQLGSMKSDEAEVVESLLGNFENLKLPDLRILKGNVRELMRGAVKDKKMSGEEALPVMQALDELTAHIKSKDPFAIIAKSSRELKKANKDAKTAQEEFNKAIATGTDKSEAAQKAAKALAKANANRADIVAKNNVQLNKAGTDGKKLTDTANYAVGVVEGFGVKVPDQLKGVLGGVGDMMDGFSSMNFANPVSIITGGVKILGGLAKSIGAIINNDGTKENGIQQKQEKIDNLKKQYEDLGKVIEKAYSTQAVTELGNSTTNLEDQKALINEQIQLEESKKNADGARIDQWKQQINSLDEQIANNKTQAVDAIFGSDLKSAIDDFASAYVDAWGAGEDRAQAQKDVVKKMLRGIIQEMIKADIAGSVEQMRNKIAEFMSDGVLSDEELEMIEKDGASIGTTMDQRGQIYGKILKDDSSRAAENGVSLVGQIRGSVATEASVAELAGIFNGQFDKLSKIDTQMGLGVAQISQIALSNTAIQNNTLRTAVATEQTVTTIKEGFTVMQNELQTIKINTQKDNGTYGN